jgi:hypothetical protein
MTIPDVVQVSMLISDHSTNLVSFSTKAHKKVIRLDVSVQVPFRMQKFYSCNLQIVNEQSPANIRYQRQASSRNFVNISNSNLTILWKVLILPSDPPTSGLFSVRIYGHNKQIDPQGLVQADQ